MTDDQLQRRLNRVFHVDDIKGKAVLVLLAVSILVACVVST